MKAHGDKCHPEQDVDGGEQHPHHVLLLLLATAKLEPGHPDGGEKGEAVVEGVHRVDTVVRGNSDGAEAEVDEEKEEAEPGRKDRKKERNKRERSRRARCYLTTLARVGFHVSSGELRPGGNSRAGHGGMRNWERSGLVGRCLRSEGWLSAKKKENQIFSIYQLIR